MPFELFTDRNVRKVTAEPLVTLQRSGGFALNQAAYEALGEPKRIELLYDRDERIIGFRPTEDAQAHTYPVSQANASHYYTFSGHAFRTHYGLDERDTGRFRARLIDGLLTVDLKEEPVSRLQRSSRDEQTSNSR